MAAQPEISDIMLPSDMVRSALLCSVDAMLTVSPWSQIVTFSAAIKPQSSKMVALVVIVFMLCVWCVCVVWCVGRLLSHGCCCGFFDCAAVWVNPYAFCWFTPSLTELALRAGQSSAVRQAFHSILGLDWRDMENAQL